MHSTPKVSIDATPPLVVVRFRPGTTIRYQKKAEMTVTESSPFREGWNQVREKFPTATLEPLYPTANPARLRALATPPSPGERKLLPVKDPTLYFSVKPELGQDVAEMVRELRALPDVVDAYPLRGPAPPPEFNPNNDPKFPKQGYLKPAPDGIDLLSIQGLAGADGKGVRFIDIEQGWVLNHEDLISAQIDLVGGLNLKFRGHGTAVLGQVVASDNNKGIVGIARACRVSTVSQWQTEEVYNTPGAIMVAIDHLEPGDVLLLEAQIDMANQPGIYYPVEIEEPTLNALAIAFNKGIIVIEAAGNGNNRDSGRNLDSLQIPGRGPVLNRNSSSFAESGAIIVGASSSGQSHERMNFSNFGSRIDCYAWGENITTTGDGEDGQDTNSYTDRFSGTSGASPIIAGVAIVIQAIQRALGGAPLMPEQMRPILSNPQTGTASTNPISDRIGVMPDLKKIVNALFFPSA